MSAESPPMTAPDAEYYRRQLQVVCDNATVALFIMDDRQQCTFMNRAAEELTGFTLAEVRGRPLHDVVHHTRPDGSRYPLAECPIDRAFPTRNRVQGEEVFVHKDGHFYPVAFTASPIRDGGRTVGTIIEVRDVSGERAAAEAVRRSEERYRRLFEQSPLSIQVLAPDGSTRRVNRAWEELWGGTFEEHLADYNLRTDPQLEAIGLRPLIERAFAGESVELPPVAYTPDRGRYAGQARWVRAFMYPVRDVDGHVEEVVLIHQDITDQRRAAEALRASEDRLRRAMNIGTVGVLFFRLDGRVTDANPAFERMSGYSAAELRGMPDWAALTSPEYRAVTARAAAEVAETGETAPYEKEMIRKNGSRWWGLFAPTRLAGAGRESECVEFVIDVTRAKAAEAALRASEGRLSDVFWFAPSLMCVLRGPDHVFERANDRYLDLVGRRDVIGRPVREALPEMVGQGYLELLDRVYRTGEPFAGTNMPARLNRRPGGPPEERFFDFVYQPLRDAGGAVTGILAQGIDVTDRARAEEEARRKQAELTDFVENATVGLHWVGPDGTILWANKAELDLLGYPREEYVGRNIAEFHADPPAIADILCRLTRGEELHAYEARLKCKDGSIRHVLISSNVFRENGEFRHTRCFTRDVTDRRLAEERLREEYRRKDEFMAMLAHELHNPLAPLRNALQILALRGTDAGVVDQVRGMMERQVTHLGRLVDDLLDVSRIATGKVQLRGERLDLARLARLAAADHRAAYEAKGVGLRVATPETPVWVSGDQTRLAQILDNLLTNALKFTARDGDVSVSVGADPGGRASVAVRDTGAGVEPEMLGRLFEPFSQADRTLDRSAGGLGLGLAVVKGLAELHGGSVRAESAGLGHGSTFTVILPAHAEPPALASRPASPRRAAKRLRVLVVEDNKDAADSLKMLLEAYGYEASVAYSGPDGVRAAEVHRPEVVICDIGLPGLDGYGVAAALRGNPATASARLIAITGYGREEDRRWAKEAGFDEHLTKPADPAALEAILAGAG